MREQAQLKGPVALGQVLDYGILKEVLANMKRWSDTSEYLGSNLTSYNKD
ncbi:MAG TPA: hypothetical protein VEQ38_07740 [Verrucomicrobiae bacterium]|nr:hypothetical protein [Verrucomicrobiae bacterium]